MRKFILFLSNKHQVILRYFLVLSTILLIVLILPLETQFNYSYKIGKPWVYENLMAPFDFSIAKSDDEVTREKAEHIQKIHPFYKVDEEVSLNQLRGLKNFINDSLKTQGDIGDEEQLKLVSSILEKIYQKGVILFDDRFPVHDDSVITIVQQNEAMDYYTGNFFTIQSAYEFIEGELEAAKIKDKQWYHSILDRFLVHNVLYDDKTTQLWTDQALEGISLSRGLVQSGEAIIKKGDVVDQEKFQKLESLKSEVKSQETLSSSKWTIRLGYFFLVSLSLVSLMIFLGLFRKEVFEDNSRLLLLMLLLLLMVGLFVWVQRYQQFDTYLVPLCILPIIVRAFYDTRIALFSHVILLMIIGHIAPRGFEFIFMQLIAGMVALFSIATFSRRSQFFISVTLIFLTYLVSYSGISLIHESTFKTIDWSNAKWFFANSFITLFAFPLIFIFEKTFGFLSDVSLMELSDSNSKLLRELSFKAPGTFQHSLQVAHLAEAAVQKVGGNPLLVRVGALYHDIGKIDMPQYFIENQSTLVNPHDELSFEDSALIIRSHVIRGVEKAKKNNIPEQIIDFIRTHHGDMRLQYFYQSFLKSYPDVIPDEEQFRYRGPLPFSKETAVLMMADSVEAASRSLKSKSRESIEDLVDSVIQNQMDQSQYINSPITMKDISDIKKIFKKMLMSVYHARIEYPS